MPQFNLNNFPDWFRELKKAFDSAELTDVVKLTYLKTSYRKRKNAIAAFSFWITMYRDALNTLERKISRAQADVAAILDKSNSFATVKMHNCNHKTRSAGDVFDSTKCIGIQTPRCQGSPAYR